MNPEYYINQKDSPHTIVIKNKIRGMYGLPEINHEQTISN